MHMHTKSINCPSRQDILTLILPSYLPYLANTRCYTQVKGSTEQTPSR